MEGGNLSWEDDKVTFFANFFFFVTDAQDRQVRVFVSPIFGCKIGSNISYRLLCLTAYLAITLKGALLG
jgi:hypothetical protein